MTEATNRVPDTRAGGVPIGGLRLPVSPRHALWWGGLAAATIVGALEWPVAAAVAAGVWVAERQARDRGAPAGRAAQPDERRSS